MGRFGGLFGQAFLAFWCTAVSGQLDSCVQIEIVFFEFVCPCDEESELYFSMTASSVSGVSDDSSSSGNISFATNQVTTYSCM